VYTPPVLARWVAGLLAPSLQKKPGTIWDIACGDGALLAAVDRATGGGQDLIGVDVDPNAIQRAASAVPNARLICADSLNPIDLSDPADGLRALAEGAPADAVILNPPWGARLPAPANHFRARGYRLATGQFDSYDLFIELSLNLLTPDGIAAFIIPDSLFQPEHGPLRRLLLEKCALQLIARIGEGMFPGVYRGAAILVARNRPPGRSHRVACFRLGPQERRAILEGRETFEEAQRRGVHHVRQASFLERPGTPFRIDVREGDGHTLDRIERIPGLRWREMLVSGRGIELSKAGWVVVCPSCGTARPRPKRNQVTCSGCGQHLPLQELLAKQIITLARNEAEGHQWAPLIAGEDVDRYSCASSRRIELGVRGIDYKVDAMDVHEKLLVRKTGVGIKAAIDGTRAFTTQVVFHYSPRGSEPEFLLDYLLGVLNSRVLAAYHLRTNGDSEWRSHPYITQSVIEQLPVPDLQQGTRRWRQARAIARAVARRRQTDDHSLRADLEIESLVAGLYELSAGDCNWVCNVLEEAQPLAAIRALRLTRDSPLRPVRVT
jgi:adenine-specific DNA-methyltransferase